MGSTKAVPAVESKAGFRQVPQYEGHWLLGCLFDMLADRGQFNFDAHAKYGDTFGSRILHRRMMFTREPALINAINTTSWESFQKPRYVKLMWEPFLGQGLVPNDGASWKRQHRLILPGFHKTRIDAYAATMVDYTERLLGNWLPGEVRDFRADMLELALEIVCDTLFDIDIGVEDAHAIHGAIVDISEILISEVDRLVPRPSWWPSAQNRQKKRAIKAVEDIIWRVLGERRTQGVDRGDLFSHMVFAQDEAGGMSDKQLRDEAMTLIFAGHETTAHALCWTWYLLATHPEVGARVREELERVLGGRRAEVSDLPELPYLEQTVKESLRLLPSVWAYGRESIEDVVCAGYFIPRGTNVIVSHLAMSHNDKYYDRPKEFRPERWTREMERNLPKGAYTPFAAGPRVCLGKQFAMMEMRMVLATILQRFTPKLAEGFTPDFVTELSRHPGPRGMQTLVTPV
jgi:cytochrome P450